MFVTNEVDTTTPWNWIKSNNKLFGDVVLIHRLRGRSLITTLPESQCIQGLRDLTLTPVWGFGALSVGYWLLGLRLLARVHDHQASSLLTPASVFLNKVFYQPFPPPAVLTDSGVGKDGEFVRVFFVHMVCCIFRGGGFIIVASFPFRRPYGWRGSLRD